MQRGCLLHRKPRAMLCWSPQLLLEGGLDPLRGGTIWPILTLPHLNVEESISGQMPRTNQTLDKGDPVFEKKLRVGSQMAIVACQLAELTAKTRSPSPDASLSSVDMHTTSELKAISQFGHFTRHVTIQIYCRPNCMKSVCSSQKRYCRHFLFVSVSYCYMQFSFACTCTKY